jgi:hypothetical protein
MAAMNTNEFDQMLAAFSFALEQAVENPPAYFDVEQIIALQDAVEDLRLTALENEASAQIALPDLDEALAEWFDMMARYEAPE